MLEHFGWYSPSMTLKVCSVDDCEKTAYALKLCSMHYTRSRRDGTPGESGRRREKSAKSYASMHVKVNNARGKARDKQCDMCAGQAHDWAVKQDAEVVSDGKRKWSLSLDDYIPLCRPCHWEYDGKVREPDFTTVRAEQCCFENCKRRQFCKGMCHAHYYRQRRRANA